ncbi:MAG: precorrin-6y C5,15-methyltransferase (decarboxylating) subunit CbiE [Alphaproteobacteria bacterium]|nr:precorrin-6y C5,15-methyltransferase (decarboxylating) subunit CbiE [Alphaproteobacteria bacterium]
MTAWLTVLGIGEEGVEALSPASRALITNAELLVGGARHLGLASTLPSTAIRIPWRTPLADTFPEIERWRGQRVVVLATGDPLCYGIGNKLLRHFALPELRLIPAPSAFSLAGARLGWDSADVDRITLHGRPLEGLRRHLAPNAKLIVLAADGSTPAAAAKLLVGAGYGESRISVFEHMGGPAERRVDGTASTWSEARTADLNTLAIHCVAGPRAKRYRGAPGLPDRAFETDGLLTKREVRAVTISLLAPHPGALLWDVGAGSGSVAIEWLLQEPRAEAIAIEREAERVALIARNAEALGTPELEIEQGEAPEVFDGLPDPDAIFIGGGLSEPSLIETCYERLKPGGRLVANAVTLEGEATLVRARQRFGGTLTRIDIARAEPLGPFAAWRPHLPVTQYAVTKEWP